MSEYPQRNEKGKKNASVDHQGYTYHWNYGEQTAYDCAQASKKRRRGALTYAFSMIAVFLACILLLAGVLIWFPPNDDTPQATPVSLTTGEVAERMNPSTVFILAKK
ncbi:MAG: hypothetical protein IJW49_12085, partial [Clostridia bacterium]|nr:hypothetical protein [Clostridia bacterium]